MLSARLVNYQEDGESDSLSGANDAINRARKVIPAELRDLYRSGIRYIDKKYYWYLVLKG